MRYFIGAFTLYGIGWFGGDIIIAALWIGAAYGFIDFMKNYH